MSTDAGAAAAPSTAAAAASGSQIAKGAAWLMLFKLADRSVGLVSTLILVRLLLPADFGLVAMATSVVALTQLMGAFGFDTALIQRQDCRREHYDTAWTFGILFGIAIAAVLAVLAVPAARFYRDERLVAILFAIAASALLGGFVNIGVVGFRKDLDFRSEFRLLMTRRFVAFFTTIGVALAFRSYWALVIGTISSNVASVALSYRLHPYRPRLTLSARADLLHFSKWMFFSNLIVFLQSRSTDFMLGRTVGSHGLGIYNVANEIAIMPSTELIAPLNRAVYPAYARLSVQPPLLYQRFSEVFGLICLICIPIAIGLLCVADPLIRVVLGPNWVEAINLVRIFAICGLAGALQSNLYLVLIALGKPKANTLLSASLLAVSLPGVVVASLYYGVIGAAFAQFAAAVLGLLGIVFVFTRNTGVRASTLARLAWRPAIASALMAAAMVAVDRAVDWAAATTATYVTRIAVDCLAGALSYVAALGVIWGSCGRPAGGERLLLDQLKRRLDARRRGARPA